MPLIKSKSPRAFQENIRTEISEGRPQRQAVAIAYSQAEGAKKTKSSTPHHSSVIDEMGSAYENNHVSSGAKPSYHPVVEHAARSTDKLPSADKGMM